MKKKSPYLKYKNPNNCSYPWTDGSNGYCWGYAGKVDGKATKKEIKKMCSKQPCEFYSPSLGGKK